MNFTIGALRRDRDLCGWSVEGEQRGPRAGYLDRREAQRAEPCHVRGLIAAEPLGRAPR